MDGYRIEYYVREEDKNEINCLTEKNLTVYLDHRLKEKWK